MLSMMSSKQSSVSMGCGNIMSRLSAFWVMVVLLLSIPSVGAIDVESCRTQGFDPANLSCDTCVLLRSTDYHLTCLDCCQSYKTLDSKATRYKEAVLVYEPGSEEIDNFVKEEMDTIKKKKRGFSVRETGEAGMSGFFSMSMNTLYFFKQKAPLGTSSSTLSNEASETIFLRGWSKDDLKDMINTLLPDNK